MSRIHREIIMRTVRSTPFVRATAVAVAVAAWLPLGSWAADPTPDPAEPSVVATSTVTKASADGSLRAVQPARAVSRRVIRASTPAAARP